MKGAITILAAVLSLVAQCLIPCRAAPIVFQDDFSGYAEGTVPEAAWETSGGKFAVRQGRLVVGGQGPSVIYAFAAPDLSEQVMEATIVPAKRTSPAGWAAAGLMLFSDGGNYWRLALVESPAKERYAELVEMHGGIWQAQTEPSTRLVGLKAHKPGFAWEEGVAYRFRITLTRSTITGEIVDANPERGGETALRFQSGFELPTSAAAVRSGRVALSTVDMEASFDEVTVGSDQTTFATRRREAVARYRVAVHDTGEGANTFVAALKASGFEAAVLSDAQMGDNIALNPGEFDALLLSDGARCPILAKENLLQFLRGGGDMLVIGGPLFEQSVKKAEAEWAANLQSLKASRLVFNFDREDVAKWQRASNNSKSQTTWGIEESGPPEARPALRMDIGDLTGWDTLGVPVREVFQQGDNLTLFWAKGDERTTAIVFEWQEKDGSRWIANVPLTPQWKRHVLASEDFLYWPDNQSKGRGGAGDRLNPQNVARFSLGVAQSHASVSSGRHGFWIAGVGSGRLPEGRTKPDLSLPTLELFSPFYKYYRLPSLNPTTEELQKAAETGHQTGPIVCPIPRPRGLGFAGNRRGRWIPLARIRHKSDQWLGTRESLFVNLGVPYRGSVWGHLAASENPSDLPGDVTLLLKRMSVGVFLARAGAEHFSYFTDEAIPFGAQAVNFSLKEREVEVLLRVTVRETGPPLFKLSERMNVLPGRSQQVQRTWKPSTPQPGVCRAITELREGGKLVDSITQEFTLLAPPKAPKSRFVYIKDGDFYDPAAPVPVSAAPQRATPNGQHRKWYPYGVNYWPSNVAGTDTFEYWVHWLSPSFYDPEIVERDLATLEDLGFTSVSIQLGNPDHVRQANEFISRAARHGIKCNLFIAGAHPFYTDEALFTRLIKEGRFAGNANLWAYDIAWEHHLGGHNQRRNWDREWEQWVVERYGTIEHAEKNWGFPIPRDDTGKVTNPSDEQLRTDGPWLKMAAAYERCADDVISRRYGKVIRKIRALDPNHLISARSASQPSWTGWFAYDMLSCGKHFDFSSPEGYGLRPEEAGFTVAYGRYAGNGKPVFWAEFGSSIYPYDTTGEKAAAQAKLHRGFAQMLLDSGANGLASWWSVGGYRVDEKSDFGIIAPDGTPRASALELRKLAGQVTSPRSTKLPSDWVTIDRDLHAAAYQAVYENSKQSYVEAVKAGKMVGVRTAGAGTTSADCPLTAVGNVPYDGFNPLKFLNAEFNWIRIKNAKGEWQEVSDGDVVEVARGKPLEAQVSAGNLGDAKWLAKGNTGAVRLIGDDRTNASSSEKPRLAFAVPLAKDVLRYEDVEFPRLAVAPRVERDSEVVLTFEAEGRARFGERRRMVLVVKG